MLKQTLFAGALACIVGYGTVPVETHDKPHDETKDGDETHDKPHEADAPGGDADLHGCRASAGYEYCVATDGCYSPARQEVCPGQEPLVCEMDKSMCLAPPVADCIDMDCLKIANEAEDFEWIMKAINKIDLGNLETMTGFMSEKGFQDLMLSIGCNPNFAEQALELSTLLHKDLLPPFAELVATGCPSPDDGDVTTMQCPPALSTDVCALDDDGMYVKNWDGCAAECAIAQTRCPEPDGTGGTCTGAGLARCAAYTVCTNLESGECLEKKCYEADVVLNPGASVDCDGEEAQYCESRCTGDFCGVDAIDTSYGDSTGEDCTSLSKLTYCTKTCTKYNGCEGWTGAGPSGGYDDPMTVVG